MNFFLPIKSFNITVYGKELDWWDGVEYRKEVPLNEEFPSDHIYNALYELIIYHPNAGSITNIEIVIDELLPDLTQFSMRYSMEDYEIKYPMDMLKAILTTKVQKALWIHQKKQKSEEKKGMIASISNLLKGSETK